MMPSKSTPNLSLNLNLREPPSETVCSYLRDRSGLRFATRDDDSPPPAPPVRDSSSLKSIKYGPGHEKFPSWPVAAAAEAPQALRNQNNGGSHRSKSWTDHTNYPKEKVVPYTRPYMKRQHSTHAQQKLKTVMEKCEKIPPEIFESRYDKVNERLFLPKVDHDGKTLGDMDYVVPSPPERDHPGKPQLTQSDLEEYARSYQEPQFCEEDLKPNHGHLTESGLEEFMEYTRNYEDSLFSSISSKHESNLLPHLHQKQISYAQSEGYHSYVSSTDSTSTPFLDRLRRDSEAAPPSRSASSAAAWASEEEGGRDSASSSETLKWRGSASDVSASAARQLIAHSARVQTPQRHHSESVLYMGGEREEAAASWRERECRNNSANKLKLFALNTYTVKESEVRAGGNGNSPGSNRLSLSLQSSLSVADRISELEKQQKYSYLDPDKKHKIPDPTLKAIQKKALLSFYERHNNPGNKSAWRSEPQLAQAPLALPQPQPPKVKVQTASRRASSASDYASGCNSKRSSLASSLESKAGDVAAKAVSIRHQHSNSCGSLSADLLGPMILGAAISVDDYVPAAPPARPPKNPLLRAAFPDLFRHRRAASPDPPPPSPPAVTDDEVFDSDEPLPPPPPECDGAWREEAVEGGGGGRQVPAPQVRKGKLVQQINGLPESDARPASVRSSVRTDSVERIFQQASSEPYAPPTHVGAILGFPSRRGYRERSSARYPGARKLVPDGGGGSAGRQGDGAAEAHRPLRKQLASLPPETTHRAHRASIAEGPVAEAPPPLQPRQMRVNQSMRARVGGHARASPDKEGIREHRSSSMSHSKASYLAPRRDRDRIVPDSETGSYKRTMSPNGHALPPEPVNDSQRLNSRDTVWPASNNILRRTSQKMDCCDGKEELKKPMVLPDVLPVNVKLLGPRSQNYGRPTHLSLSPDVSEPPKSPFTPSRSPSFSTSTATTSTVVTSTPTSRFSLSSRTSSASLPRTSPSPSSDRYTPPGSPKKTYHPTPKSPRRISPPIKPSLSPNSTMKLSPIRNSPTIHNTPVSSPKEASPPLNDYPQVIEGLQLIQRTEVVLRVNTSMADAASQTEKEELPPTPLPVRRKLQEEIECEKLAEDLIDHLPTLDRLKELLVPGPEHKKPADYVHGLFRAEVTSRPRPLNSPFRSKNNTPGSTPPPTLASVSTSTTCSITSKLSLPSSVEPTSPLSGSSAYFTTSEPKAKFLTRYSQDMSACHIAKNTKDLNEKKEELVRRLDRKLEVLRGEQLLVADERRINDELGDDVESRVDGAARPRDAAKFRLHVEEVGKITSLLLGLSGRLARAENALAGMADDHPERRILEAKRDKLLDQLQEAKQLKESIDRRSVNVSNFLYEYLDSDEYADYDHFINMKAKLIVDAKEIGDKIKLGEEQLAALKDTLLLPPVSD